MLKNTENLQVFYLKIEKLKIKVSEKYSMNY